MIGARATSSSVDRTAELGKLLEAVSRLQVYVGIPEDDAARKSGEITNAQLAYLHTHGVRSAAMQAEMAPNVEKLGYGKAYEMYLHSHGSPLWFIPPRPIIEPAIEAEGNKEAIAGQLAEAARSAMEGDREGAKRHLELAGMEGQNSARDWFEDPRNGWAPNSPVTIALKGSERPLVDTGELRKSITYVVKESE